MQLLDIGWVAPPARFRPAAQGAEARAWHIGQHPGKRSSTPRPSGAVSHHDGRSQTLPGIGPDGTCDQARAVRREIRCQQLTAVQAGQTGQQGGLAARSGTQVEPPSGRSGHFGQSPGNQLGALVLDAGSAVTDQWQAGPGHRASERRKASTESAAPQRGSAPPPRQGRAGWPGRSSGLRLLAVSASSTSASGSRSAYASTIQRGCAVRSAS